MRKFLLLAILVLNFAFLPSSFAAETTVLEGTAQSEVQDLDIEIPEDTEPGFHEISVQVFDTTDSGSDEVSEKTYFFCKSYDGSINWDNNCPDLAGPPPSDVAVAIVDPATLEEITDIADLPAYTPVSEPTKTVTAQVAGFAALSVLSLGTAAAAAAGAAGGGVGGGSSSQSGGSQPAGRRDDTNSPARLPSVGVQKSSDTSEELPRNSVIRASSLAGAAALTLGRGDRSFTWRAPFTTFFDQKFNSAASRMASFSPLLAKTLSDGSYLRSIFGAGTILLYLGGLALTWIAMESVSFQAMPPKWYILAAMLLISIFDSFAGLLMGSFLLTTYLITGNINSVGTLMTIFGLFAICYAPPMISRTIRPLYRKVIDGDSRWERLTDYALISIITGWTVQKIVEALNGLARLQFPITAYAREIGTVAAIGLLVRLILVEIAARHYPARVVATTSELSDPGTLQSSISLLLKVAFFAIVATRLMGNSPQIWIGAAIFALPLLASQLSKGRLPKFQSLSFLLPRGSLKIVVMVFIGAQLASFAQSQFSDPAKYVSWSFVILSLPALIFSLSSLVAADPKSAWREKSIGRLLYRIAGIAVFVLVVLLFLGRDITQLAA